MRPSGRSPGPAVTRPSAAAPAGVPRLEAARRPAGTALAIVVLLGLAGGLWWRLRPAPAVASALARGPEVRGAFYEPRWIPGVLDPGPGAWPARAAWLRQRGFRDVFVPAMADGRPTWPGPLDDAAAAAAEAGLGVFLVAAGPEGAPRDPAAAPALRETPEAAMVSRVGTASLAGGAGPLPWAPEPAGTEAVWGSWCAPEVRRRLAGLVVEALARAPDARGVHLDGLAFPGPDFDFGPACTEAFEAQRGWSVDGTTVAARADVILARHAAEWADFRAGQVTEALRTVRRALDAAGDAGAPGGAGGSAVALTVTVDPDPARAYRDFGQDWPGWVREGLVDAVVAAFPEPDPAAVARWLDDARELGAAARRAAGRAPRRGLGGGWREPVWMVMLVLRPDAPPTPGEVAAAIAAARAGGAAGVVLRPAGWLDPATRGAFLDGRGWAPAAEAPDYGPVLDAAFGAGGP